VIYIPLLNIHIKDAEKKKLRIFIENQANKSMSKFVREIIAEKMKIEELASKIGMSEAVEIPDYIPKNKYVIFVNGAVVAIGDNPSDLAEIAVQKFSDFPFVIKYNGPKKKPMEYFYMSLTKFHGWKYSVFEDSSYPIIPIELESITNKRIINASFDTAASLCVLKTNVFPSEKCEISRKEQISTVTGIIEAPIYKGKVKILDATFEIEFIIAPIADVIPSKFLIGRNLMDQLDAYFLGKKQILLLKLAES
jgi:hypothetical protein